MKNPFEEIKAEDLTLRRKEELDKSLEIEDVEKRDVGVDENKNEIETPDEIERQELLDRTREKIKRTDTSEEASEQNEKEQRDFEDLFEQVEGEKGGVEKAIKLSPVGIVTESISNIKKSQEVRDETAERKVSEVIKALEDVYGDIENIKKDVETIVDLGAGWGENLKDSVKSLGAEKAIGVDPKTIFSKKVDKEIGDKLGWMRRDALEVMKLIKDRSVDLTTAFAFLQVLDKSEKIAMLREMGRVAKEGIVIVDELKRSGMEGLKDLVVNKLYNAGMGKYEILEEGEWKDIFEEAGLTIEAFNKFGNNDFVAILKKVEAEEVE